MVKKGRFGTGNVYLDWQDVHITPSKPKKVKGGISLASQRGDIGRKWWSKRWIEVLESFGWTNRLQRGRRYARQGQVIELSVTREGVKAKVQGTRKKPYIVTICLTPTTTRSWKRIADALNEDAGLVARLLDGEVPKELEKVYKNAKSSLLPTKAREIDTNCSCPDTANPCKHVAAVHYILAERLDQDPFLIFLLRGKERDEVLAAISPAIPGVDKGATRATRTPAPLKEEVKDQRSGSKAGTKERLVGYWRPGPRFATTDCTPHPPDVDLAIPRRIGDPDFCSAAQSTILNRTMASTYGKVSMRALNAASGESEVETLPRPRSEDMVGKTSGRKRGRPKGKKRSSVMEKVGVKKRGRPVSKQKREVKKGRKKSTKKKVGRSRKGSGKKVVQKGRKIQKKRGPKRGPGRPKKKTTKPRKPKKGQGRSTR